MAGGEEPLVFAFIMLWRGKEDSPQPIAGQDEKGQPFGQLAAEERLTRAWQAAHHYKRRLYLGLGQVVVKALPQSCHIFSQGTCHNRSIITMTQRMCQDAGATASLDIIACTALDNAASLPIERLSAVVVTPGLAPLIRVPGCRFLWLPDLSLNPEFRDVNQCVYQPSVFRPSLMRKGEDEGRL